MLIYLIIVLLFCAIYPLVPRKHIKWLFIALVLALSIMAFFAVPKIPTISIIISERWRNSDAEALSASDE